jgi:carboxymethylenebutenolidase
MTTSTSLSVKSRDGLEFQAYVASPKSGSGPAIIVIQEIFGINSWIRSVADGLAQQGYFAVAPDLFHRQEPGIQLTDQTEAEWAKAFELYKGFDENKGVDDIADTMAAARNLPGCNGKVGAMGYCLGGKLAFLVSTRTDATCSVGFYGVAIENNLNEEVRLPLMLHIAAEDKYVPPEVQKQIHDKLGKNPLVTLLSYPADHAFCRVGGEHYDKEQCQKANDATAAFFKKHLG